MLIFMYTISKNSLIGRNNNRSLSGPIKLPNSPGELMKKVENAYQTFFQLWNTVMIPKLMKLPKWFEGGPAELVIGDIVYFQKVENDLSSIWTVGKIVDITKSKDGKVRRASVEYRNSNEDFSRQSDRAARSLIKLCHIDDNNWSRDMKEVDNIIKSLDREKENSLDQKQFSVHPISETSVRISVIKAVSQNKKIGRKLKAWLAMARKPCKNCCCGSHCMLFSHEKECKLQEIVVNQPANVDCPDIMDASWRTLEETEELEALEYDENLVLNRMSGLSALIMRTGIDFDYNYEQEEMEAEIQSLKWTDENLHQM